MDKHGTKIGVSYTSEYLYSSQHYTTVALITQEIETDEPRGMAECEQAQAEVLEVRIQEFEPEQDKQLETQLGLGWQHRVEGDLQISCVEANRRLD